MKPTLDPLSFRVSATVEHLDAGTRDLVLDAAAQDFYQPAVGLITLTVTAGSGWAGLQVGDVVRFTVEEQR
jgi:hypothetical protein